MKQISYSIHDVLIYVCFHRILFDVPVTLIKIIIFLFPKLYKIESYQYFITFPIAKYTKLLLRLVIAEVIGSFPQIIY